MGFAQLQHWARAQLLHDRVRVSSSLPADLLLPDVNVVHIRRCSPVHPKHIQRQAEELGVGFHARVLASTVRPGVAAEELAAPLGVEEVRQWLQEDIAALVGVFGEQLGYPSVSAKLEVLGSTPCPRFHADHVGVRLLVSYCGPGTVFVDNRHVRRRWLWGGAGGVAVAEVDASRACQAAPGDLLFLKGHSAPGNYGMGAVHRSPDLQPQRSNGSEPVVPGFAAAARGQQQAVAALAGKGEGPVMPPPGSTGMGVGAEMAGEAGFAVGLRLLLTVDDVTGWAAEGGPACGCGQSHAAQGNVRGLGPVLVEGAGAHRADASITLR